LAIVMECLVDLSSCLTTGSILLSQE